MAGQRSRGQHGSSQGSSRRGKKADGSGSSPRRGELSADQLQGRAPSGEPDVVVDIHKVKVDEIYVDVEHLEAHLTLRASLANLLQVVAGVHVHLGKAEVDITGVEAEALMEVRLENLYDILDRALTTLDRNPEILESLVDSADNAVGDIGNLGRKALGSGGAVGQAAGGLGQAAGGLGQGLSQTAGQAVGGVAQMAGGAGGQAGQAGNQAAEQAGDATQGLEQEAAGGQNGAAAANQSSGDDGVKHGRSGARWLIPLAAGAGVAAAAAVRHAKADRETDAEARD
jgi:hypothetical protein